MFNQYTIDKPIKLQGIDIPSGNTSNIFLEPSEPDTGIVFETPKGEQIKAILGNTSSSLFWFAKTLTLEGEKEHIACPEHLITPLKTYVDNAKIKLQKKSSFSSAILKHFPIGSGRNTYFVPHIGKKLCEALEGNIREQDKPRKILRLEEKIITDKLEIRPIDGDNIIIGTTTDYKLKDGHIKQEKELKITPESIKAISLARGYCLAPTWAPQFLTKAVSGLFFITQGFGNGNNPSNIFYYQKTKERWLSQQLMENEIACHTIIDRLAELFLLPGRIKGIYLYCKFAGHKEGIETLKENQYKFHFE